MLRARRAESVCAVRGEGLATIDENALDRVPDRELFDGAMAAWSTCSSGTATSTRSFSTEDEADPLRTEIRQQFGGIGVRIGFEGEPPRLTIVGPPEPGSPAARENLRAGDRILAIDGRPTDGMKMTDVLQVMRGLPARRCGCRFSMPTNRQPRTVELVREIINIESIFGDRRGDDGSWRFQLEADPRIAHVRIASFGERTAGELGARARQM